MMLLFNLGLFLLVSAALQLLSRWVLRRWPSVQASPRYFVTLALLSLLVFVPWPDLQQPLLIPAHLLQDTQWQLAQWQATPQHPQLRHSATPFDLLTPLAYALLACSGWRLSRVAIGYWRLRRLVQGATPVQPSLADWPAQVSLKQFAQAQSAFACGLLRPTVMIPGYVSELTGAQQQLVLRHELVHLQRGDAWTLLAWQLLTALAWFNPWLPRWQQAWQHAAELQVDRTVCAQLQSDLNAVCSTEPAQPLINPALLYAQTLLWCLKRNQASAPSTTMAWSTGQQQYQERLTQLFQPSAPLTRAGRALLLGGVGVISLVIAAGCSQLQQPSGDIAWSSPVALGTPVSSPFGEVLALRDHKPHMGIDLAGAAGAPIYATARGTVLLSDASSLNPNYGNAVLLDHGQGYQTLYAHLERSAVRAGDTVTAGQIIGWIGQTGKATGPHLHFEWLHHGVQQDPTALLQQPPQS